MSSNDSLLTAVLVAVVSLISVAVGVLLRGQVEAGQRKQIEVNRTVLLALRTSEVFHELLNHIGLNQAKLAPILPENLEGKGFTKAQFQSILNDAISAFPLPTPAEISLPEGDPHGYILVKISGLLREYVRNANEAAGEIRSGSQDVTHVSRFLVAAQMAIDTDFVLTTAEKQFTSYLESLETIYERKGNQKEKARAVKKYVSDLKGGYDAAVEMEKAISNGRTVTEKFLRDIGW